MSHYFHTPTGAENRREIRARFWDTDWTFTTAAGVFSADGLDLGTAVLLRESAPPSGATRLLDLGCGYGVLAVALATACPQASVDAVDVNERALELTATNAAAHGVADRVHPMLPEQVEPDVRYDQIWSNPPIRIGKDALHDLLLTWLPDWLPAVRPDWWSARTWVPTLSRAGCRRRFRLRAHRKCQRFPGVASDAHARVVVLLLHPEMRMT